MLGKSEIFGVLFSTPYHRFGVKTYHLEQSQ